MTSPSQNSDENLENPAESGFDTHLSEEQLDTVDDVTPEQQATLPQPEGQQPGSTDSRDISGV